MIEIYLESLVQSRYNRERTYMKNRINVCRTLIHQSLLMRGDLHERKKYDSTNTKRD